MIASRMLYSPVCEERQRDRRTECM